MSATLIPRAAPRAGTPVRPVRPPLTTSTSQASHASQATPIGPSITSHFMGMPDIFARNEEGDDKEKLEMVDKWEGYNHRKLSEEGYRSLAVLTTFLAGMQAQVLSSTLTGGRASQYINACFIGGLLADVFSAIMSFGSARWFEMLTREEEDLLQKFQECADAEGQKITAAKHSLIDRWVALSIVMGPYAAVLGLALFILGLMIFVWANQPLVVKIVTTIICCFFVAFIPPFALRHNRMCVLSLLRLRRRSG